MTRISAYDPEAVRPAPGTIWAWEPDSPWAAALLRVEQCYWNGEEWWVITQRICETDYFAHGHDGELARNDLSRFWEACHYVSPHAGEQGRVRGLRRGAPQADELQWEGAGAGR